jgi:acyl-CoA thioester hydrolase
VVIRAELDYKNSLVSNDHFVVRSLARQVSRVRFEFKQDLFRIPDEKLMLAAIITGTSLNQRGRPFLPEMLNNLFGAE